jgi:hypothetical protein
MTVGIKPSNLTDEGIFVKPTQNEFGSERQYDHIFFWPAIINDRIPIQAFPDFPHHTQWHSQDVYIQKILGWKTVDTIGGVEEPGRAEGTFLLLCDSNDETSPINYAAQAIINLLPDYQLNKVPKLRRGQHDIRGACILVYSPMKTTFGGSHIPRTQTVEANEDRLFTHQELYNIIEFHQTNSARKQYKGHDNLVHRTLDGMM